MGGLKVEGLLYKVSGIVFGVTYQIVLNETVDVWSSLHQADNSYKLLRKQWYLIDKKKETQYLINMYMMYIRNKWFNTSPSYKCELLLLWLSILSCSNVLRNKVSTNVDSLSFAAEFYQKALKEKEEHIEQLLRERDMERQELVKSAALVEEVTIATNCNFRLCYVDLVSHYKGMPVHLDFFSSKFVGVRMIFSNTYHAYIIVYLLKVVPFVQRPISIPCWMSPCLYHVYCFEIDVSPMKIELLNYTQSTLQLKAKSLTSVTP